MENYGIINNEWFVLSDLFIYGYLVELILVMMESFFIIKECGIYYLDKIIIIYKGW